MIGRARVGRVPKPQIVTVAGGAALTSGKDGSGTALSVISISEDWSSGKSGYTVEIGALDKVGAYGASTAGSG